MTDQMAFAYHRSVAPMMWVFVAIASVELVVVHFLLAMWRPLLALLLSALSLSTVLWLVTVIRSFRTLPVLVDAEHLVLRVGRLKGVDVDMANVAGLRSHWDGSALKAPGVLNLALLAYPNVVVDLLEPVTHGRRSVGSVAHRLDDPVAFAVAMEARIAA